MKAGSKLTDNEYVAAAADVTTEQLEEDKDASVEQRLMKGFGTAAKDLSKTGIVGDNEVAKG